MYFAYLAQSKKDNTYYIGSTSDLKKRIKEHNQGKTKSLKHKLPVKLIYFEGYASKRMVLKIEKELKKNSFKKKEIIERLKDK